MKLEHLLKAYKLNNINAEIKNVNNEIERAGVITFTNGISASYLLDNEDIVIAMKIFFNCLVPDNKGKLTVINQIEHTKKIITIIQKTMMLLSNIPQKEANMILEHLGLFDNTFRSGKQIKHLEHEYRIETIDGLLCFTVNEVVEKR